MKKKYAQVLRYAKVLMWDALGLFACGLGVWMVCREWFESFKLWEGLLFAGIFVFFFALGFICFNSAYKVLEE